MIGKVVDATDIVGDSVRLQACNAVLGGKLDAKASTGSVEPVDVDVFVGVPDDLALVVIARWVVYVEHFSARVVIGGLGEGDGRESGKGSGEVGEETNHLD